MLCSTALQTSGKAHSDMYWQEMMMMLLVDETSAQPTDNIVIHTLLSSPVRPPGPFNLMAGRPTLKVPWTDSKLRLGSIVV